MSEERLPEELQRAIRHLGRPVEVDPDAKARLLAAVAADRAARQHPAPVRPIPARRFHRVTGIAAAAVVAAAIALGLSRDRTGRQRAAASPSAPATAVPTRPASGGHGGARGAARPHRFAARVGPAERVALVGDFNGWDRRATPMRHDPATGRWVADVMLRPGRYAYALVVDDSVWTPDPDAARTSADELGVSRSILVVDSLPR